VLPGLWEEFLVDGFPSRLRRRASTGRGSSPIRCRQALYFVGTEEAHVKPVLDDDGWGCPNSERMGIPDGRVQPLRSVFRVEAAFEAAALETEPRRQLDDRASFVESRIEELLGEECALSLRVRAQGCPRLKTGAGVPRATNGWIAGLINWKG
jgi:hypothetical protein